MENEKLKACPFCGEKADLHKITEFSSCFNV